MITQLNQTTSRARQATAPRASGVESKILRHHRLNSRYFELTLFAPEIAHHARPGQFVMITVTSGALPVLPRPMAIYNVEPQSGVVSIVYAVVGRGTVELSQRLPGESVYVLGPLGNGFELNRSSKSLLLVGRGIGICSLTLMASWARVQGIVVSAVVSARNQENVFGLEFFKEQKVKNLISVTDETGDSEPHALAMRLKQIYGEQKPDLILTCGSRRLENMCNELGDAWNAEVQVSLEAQMACGIGFCHGCASGEVGGQEESPLICADGPVFMRRCSN